MWAVATACPTERATAIAVGLVDSRAAACAPDDAARASPTEAFPFFHSWATSRAVRKRSSTVPPRRRTTCSAQSQAHAISWRCRSIDKGPPRCSATNRSSRMLSRQPPQGDHGHPLICGASRGSSEVPLVRRDPALPQHGQDLVDPPLHAVGKVEVEALLREIPPAETPLDEVGHVVPGTPRTSCGRPPPRATPPCAARPGSRRTRASPRSRTGAARGPSPVPRRLPRPRPGRCPCRYARSPPAAACPRSGRSAGTRRRRSPSRRPSWRAPRRWATPGPRLREPSGSR